jgi:hypothetical protein
MKVALKATDFDFEYTGSDFTEKEIIEKRYIRLSGKELLSRISNKTIFGEYPMGYKFATDIYANGTANGINNLGSVDSGKWVIDFEKNTLQLKWTNGWINTLTRAYLVNDNIEFYDTDSGKWRTTFKVFKNWEEE